MTRERKLAEILKGTAKDHHLAFKAKKGQDPKWPKWYAKDLLKKSEFKRLIPGLSQDTLSHLLEMLDHQYKNDKTRQSWEHYYASKLLKIG